MVSGFFIAQGRFFSILPHVDGRRRNRFEDWSSVELGFGFEAQCFRPVVVLVLTRLSSSKVGVKASIKPRDLASDRQRARWGAKDVESAGDA
jgi:hypothetical protein